MPRITQNSLPSHTPKPIHRPRTQRSPSSVPVLKSHPKLPSFPVHQGTHPARPIPAPSKRGGPFRSGHVLHINGDTNFTPLALLNNVGTQLSSDLLGKLSSQETAQADHPAPHHPKSSHPSSHEPLATTARKPTEVEHLSIAPKGKLLTYDMIPQRTSIVSLTDTASVFLSDIHDRSQPFQPPGFGRIVQPLGSGSSLPPVGILKIPQTRP